MKLKFKKILACILTVTAIVAAVPSTISASAVSYGQNGYHCTKKHCDTGKLIIGDSRTCQLWNYKNKGASFVSVWGGHYGYRGSSGQIDTSSQKNTMKDYIKTSVNKKGYCNVYIFATVNDFNGGTKAAAKGPANNVIKLAKELKNYNSKANITVVSLVGTKGKNVSAFNTYLKNNLPNKVKWLNISDCLKGSNSGYQIDNTHYNNTTLKNIWSKIK